MLLAPHQPIMSHYIMRYLPLRDTVRPQGIGSVRSRRHPLLHVAQLALLSGARRHRYSRHTWSATLHLGQHRLCLRQPESHLHRAVQRDGGGQLDAGLLSSTDLGI
jgi:hypothetical protein